MKDSHNSGPFCPAIIVDSRINYTISRLLDVEEEHVQSKQLLHTRPPGRTAGAKVYKCRSCPGMLLFLREASGLIHLT